MEIINRFTNQNFYPTTNWLLRRMVYLFLIFYFGRLIPFASDFFAEDTYINKFFFDGNISKWVVQSFNFQGVRSLYPMFLIIEFVLLILGIIGFYPKLIGLGIYGCTLILQQSMVSITNGGEQLLYNCLFFMVFLEEKDSKDSFWITISNFALFAIRLEVAFLYLVAGFTKLTGDLWPSGDAFYYVSQIGEYSSPWLMEFIKNNLWVGVVLTYLTIFYQTTFPFAIWFKKLKYKWMVVGVVFHISIGFLNGIMDFGLIMLTMYFAFYNENRSKKVYEFFSEIKSAGKRIINAKGD